MRGREITVWFLLVAVIFPVLTISVVSGYGFAIWASQQIYGPPHATAASH